MPRDIVTGEKYAIDNKPIEINMFSEDENEKISKVLQVIDGLSNKEALLILGTAKTCVDISGRKAAAMALFSCPTEFQRES